MNATHSISRRRARPLLVAIGVVVGLATACSPPPSTSTTLETSAGDALPSVQEYGVIAAPPLPTDVPTTAFDPETDIAVVDGSVVVTTDGPDLVVTTGNGGDGDGDGDGNRGGVERIHVGATAELRAVSASGMYIALFERPAAEISRITVVDRTDDEPRIVTHDLPGLVEPEAFSTDGTLLFVIDHQVAAAPGAYRVRPLDLRTGRLETIVGPTKVPFDDDMNGIGRRQVWAPGGGRLYTLYIRQSHDHQDAAHDTGHANGQPGTDGFVHVLDLDEEWAYCLDLPPAFGGGDLASTALAVAPDGRTIAVADVSAGQIAFASTVDLSVTRTVPMPRLQVSGELQIGLTNDGLVLGSGTELHWFDTSTMRALTAAPVQLDDPLRAITSDGQSVFAWTTNAVNGPQILDAPSG